MRDKGEGGTGGGARYGVDFEACVGHDRPADQHTFEREAGQLPRLRRSEREIDHAGAGQNGPPGDNVIGEEAVPRLIYRPVGGTGPVGRCARALLVGLEHGSRTVAAPGRPAPWLRVRSAPPGGPAGGFSDAQTTSDRRGTTPTGPPPAP